MTPDQKIVAALDAYFRLEYEQGALGHYTDEVYNEARPTKRIIGGEIDLMKIVNLILMEGGL